MSALLSSASSSTLPLLSSLSERGLLLMGSAASFLRPHLLRVIELGVSQAVSDANVATAVKKEEVSAGSQAAGSAVGLSPAGPARLLPSGLLPQSTAAVAPVSKRSHASASRATLQVVSPLCKSRSFSSPSVASPDRSSTTAQQQQQGASSSMRTGSLLLSARSSSRSLQASSLAPPPSPRSPAPPSELLSVCTSLLRRLGSSQVKEEASVIAGRIQLSHILALLFAAVSLLLSVCVPLLVVQSSSSSSSALWAATLCRLCPLSFLLVPLLNQLGHNVTSRVALLLMTHCWLLLLTLAWPGCGWPSFHYSTLPLSLVLFDAALDSAPFLLCLLVPLAANVASVTLNAVASPALASINSLLSYAVLAAILHELLTQYRRNEASLLSASRSSRAAYTAMTSLMHSISHELRTPLNAVTGYTELLLLDPSLSSSQQDMVRTIADNADALTKLVSDFLTFSSSSHGQLRVEAEIVDVEEMMDACVGSHALAAHRKGVEVVYEIDDDVPALVVADGQRVREVLSNLITNSITASTSGCVHVRISLLLLFILCRSLCHLLSSILLPAPLLHVSVSLHASLRGDG
jgi:hypothetical protein